jgi:pimeloyl-ACP methyl ester carboxylesterase
MLNNFKICTFCAVVIGITLPAVSAFEIGQISVTYFDPVRSRDVGANVFYPADNAGSSVPVAEGYFPVVVFGHGFLLGTGNYDFVRNSLVPQGYIVALPTTESGFSPNHLTFGRDLAFLSEYFQVMNTDPDSMFFERVAPDSAIIGHSMGGGSSFLAIEYSGSVVAIANFSAAETNPSAITAAESITLPALLFAGTEDCVTPPEDHQIPMYNALASDCKTYISINGASHCQFAQNAFICTLGEIGCSADISRNEQETITMQYLSIWLDFVLRGNQSAWITFQTLLDSGVADETITFQQQCDEPEPTSTPAPTVTPEPECINNGDANLDGVITAADAQLAFNFALGTETPTWEQACAADCNGDDIITAADAQQIFYTALGTGECVDALP